MRLINIVRYGIFSSFFLNLLGFWNIAILYKFLYLKTFPFFANGAMNKISEILFAQNGILSTI